MKLFLLALLERATPLEGTELTPPTVCPVACSGTQLGHCYIPFSPLLVPRTRVLPMGLSLIIGNGGWSILCNAVWRTTDTSQASQ